MKQNEDNIVINITIYEVILIVSIVAIILGLIFTFQTKGPGEILIGIGIWTMCGYITKKILPNNKRSFSIGFVLGIIGIIVVIIIKNSQNNSKVDTDIYDALEKIKQLKDNGTITETEFEIEKNKLLKGEEKNGSENQ